MKVQQHTTQVKLNTKYSKTPCDGCKGHHIKCDKSLAGCKNCIRRGIECTYLITRKRRGPKTKVETMMKLLESLNNTTKNSEAVESSTTTDQFAPTNLIEKETNQCSESQSSEVSSPMQATPVFSDDFTLYQATQVDLPVYQDIYSLSMADTNIYNVPPLPSDLSSFEPSLTIPISYDQMPWQSILPHFDDYNQQQSDQIESFDFSSNQYYNPSFPSESFQNSFCYY